MDDPLNQDDIGENELLVVSFGTSFNDSRRLTIDAIEKSLIAAFPDRSVRRGFTAQIVIDHVKSRDGEVIDNLTEALDRAVANGVKTLVVQPTHLMDGLEYNDIVDELGAYADAFDKIVIGKNLLGSDEDFQRVAQIIVDATAEYDDGETAICFMGHGTEAESNAVYAKMQQILTDMGKENYLIGTVEASPSVDDVLALVQAGDYKKVVLEPLMLVAGDHANNDMDCVLARHLAARVITEQPFSPISDRAFAEARQAVGNCELVIDAGITWGESNARRRELLRLAEAAGKLERA